MHGVQSVSAAQDAAVQTRHERNGKQVIRAALFGNAYLPRYAEGTGKNPGESLFPETAISVRNHILCARVVSLERSDRGEKNRRVESDDCREVGRTTKNQKKITIKNTFFSTLK